MEEVRRRLASSRLDGVLLSHLPNIRYLTGFTGSAGALIVTQDTAWLVTDGRYRIQAAQEVTSASVRIASGSAVEHAGKLLSGRRALRVGYEADYVSVSALKALKSAGGKAVRWGGIRGWVEEARSVKDAAEVLAIRASARLASGILRSLLPMIKPGVAELDLAAEMDYQMRRKGAEGPSFETIVASGPRTALPHARPTSRRIGKNELVLLDWGAILRGYCSDLTRTLLVGRASGRILRWFKAVRDAQQAAIEAARPGATAGKVDRAARRVLEQAGFGRYFSHSTGHGVGLEIHEGPRLARNRQERLQAGNVVTIEPGMYVEGVGGIRLEDDILISEKGPELLTSAPREFLQL